MDAGCAQGGNPAALPPVVSTLVRLLDCRGHALHVDSEQQLRFVCDRAASGSSPAGAAGAGRRQVWVLRGVAAGQFALQHAASRKFLAAVGGQLRLQNAPETLQVFMDLDQRVALRLAGKACLQSGLSGAALAGRLPLGRDRASKLFRLEEAALPPHALQAWPLRAALRCEHDGGGYLSAGSDGQLSVSAPVACCSEEFVLALGEAARLQSQGGSLKPSLVAPSCTLWAGDGRRLLSHRADTGQVLLRRQHCVAGRELFTLRLSSSGELSLLAEQPAVPHSPQAGTREQRKDPATREGGATQLAPVSVWQGGLVACSRGGKAARFSLELASNKPTLLLTAHGQLLRCGRAESRPSGALLPPPPAPQPPSYTGSSAGLEGWAGGSSSGGVGAAAGSPARSALLASAAWLLEHHGDSVYSVRHGASRRSLYIDDSGAPRLDARGGHIVYPDERLLFWIELAWVTLEAPAEQGSSSNGSRARPDSSTSSGSSSGGGGDGHAGSPVDDGNLEAGSEAARFVQPPPGASGSLAAAGFSIRSVCRLGGRHLYLSALPDGLLTTVHAGERPTRWELFSPIDYQTLLHSPLRLLDRLPCAPPASPQPPQQQQQQQHSLQAHQLLLRRTMSMQALSAGGSAASLAPTRQRCSNDGPAGAPSLSTVHEHRPASPAPRPEQQAASVPSSRGEQQQQQEHQRLGTSVRRCQSETALADMQARAGRQRRPLWLAQLLCQPRQPEGWGVCSAASLQDLACRQLCVSLVRQYGRQYGGRGLPAGLVSSVEAELSGHLPEEVAARIAAELRLLAEPPPPTKLSLHQLAKAAAVAGGAAEAAAKQLVPDWAVPLLEGAGASAERSAAALLQWQPHEAFLCACCAGASGALMPLDPYINPSHHLFLHAMERRARGGGRVRLRARRRHDREDPLLLALHTGKLVVLAWALGKTLAAVFSGGGGSSRR